MDKIQWCEKYGKAQFCTWDDERDYEARYNRVRTDICHRTCKRRSLRMDDTIRSCNVTLARSRCDRASYAARSVSPTTCNFVATVRDQPCDSMRIPSASMMRNSATTRRVIVSRWLQRKSTDLIVYLKERASSEPHVELKSFSLLSCN